MRHNPFINFNKSKMDSKHSKRRDLLKSIFLLPAITITGGFETGLFTTFANTPPRKFRLSLNAYSFNAPLSNGSMKLDELLEYCAANALDAVDITGYYFPGYPQVPSDEFIYHIKHKAFLLGLDISGTGVRNDFTNPDLNKRKQDVMMVKKWIEVASKLGAPVIRIFSGPQQPAAYSREQVLNWMISDIKECVQHGKEYGVVVAIQNHNDFIKTAAETKEIINKVNDDWFGLILDIGSYRGADPYTEIREMAPDAVSWQLKETMFVNGIEEKTNVKKIIRIARDSGYKGYLPIETLGPGDPKIKIAVFLEKVRKAMK
jgi:sugar phosphate isomerase/epimerase